MWNIFELESEPLMFHVEHQRSSFSSGANRYQVFGTDRVRTRLRPSPGRAELSKLFTHALRGEHVPRLVRWANLLWVCQQDHCSTWNIFPSGPDYTGARHGIICFLSCFQSAYVSHFIAIRSLQRWIYLGNAMLFTTYYYYGTCE